jgi:hypothetical protein
MTLANESNGEEDTPSFSSKYTVCQVFTMIKNLN